MAQSRHSRHSTEDYNFADSGNSRSLPHLDRDSFLENQDFFFDGNEIRAQGASQSVFHAIHGCPTNRERPSDFSIREYWIHDQSCNTGNGVVEGDGYNSWAYINAAIRNDEGIPVWVSEGRADASQETNWLETWKLNKIGQPVSFTSCWSGLPSTHYGLWKWWDYECSTVDAQVCRILRSGGADDQEIIRKIQREIEIELIDYDSGSAIEILKHIQHMKFNTKVKFDLMNFRDVLVSEPDSLSSEASNLATSLSAMCGLFERFTEGPR